MLWKSLQNKINGVTVFIIEVPRMLARLEPDGNLRYKSKENFPAKEKMNDGCRVLGLLAWHLREESLEAISGFLQPQLGLQGSRMLGQAEEPKWWIVQPEAREGKTPEKIRRGTENHTPPGGDDQSANFWLKTVSRAAAKGWRAEIYEPGGGRSAKGIWKKGQEDIQGDTAGK